MAAETGPTWTGPCANRTPPARPTGSGTVRWLVDQYTFETVDDVSEVTSITLWVNCKRQRGIRGDLGAIYVDGGWTSYVILNASTTQAWRSMTWTGSWAQADVDAFQAAVLSAITGTQTLYVYEVYAEVGYEPAAGPTVFPAYYYNNLMRRRRAG